MPFQWFPIPVLWRMQSATSIGNRITSKADIEKAIDRAKHIDGVRGIAVIVGEKIGMWGNLEVVPLTAKKG